MIRLKWSKNTMLLLSVLLALLLWVYVNIVQNPVKEQEFRVALETRGELPQGLTVSGLPKSVTVRVQGKNTQLSGIRSADFQAYVDLGNIGEGENSRPVQVSAPSGLQVIQVNPARLNLVAERLIQKQLPVAAAVKGEPLSGYTALEPVVQPTAVLVRGPAKVLQDLKKLELTVDITGTSQNIEQQLMIPLPAGVAATPDRVKVLVPVTRALPSRTLPVVPRYSGSPADPYQLLRVIPQPATVQVYAPVEVLQNLDIINTETIRIDGITGDVIKEARLLLPAGVVDIIPGKVELAFQVKPKQPADPEPVEKPQDNTGPAAPEVQP
ncbi:CdaR family protein [Desulforamulus hydrothermalis]|uniref:YbbR family protein n=1 Tax=Desulforamulus hydrothermalis Lam5 = DSM 18033 TaxID=1121428 RepID=K8DYK9_9FIRM|nr:CdaR family protein [Desulforamulus hydrothermalis]CCO07860.1 YbbR family protein [Desulforamulus hydrothermalis Lam5 = DSM 18033]SHH27900.1 YbbR domain-containing protein [Desulforamulus hydrothermalis Lam5 = DSM 18033]